MGLPFKPSDWVSDDADRIARVRSVYEASPGEILLDLVIFDRDGNRLGRVSPVMGGPRTFEPACSSERWHRVKKPTFPLQLQWVGEGTRRRARFWAGDRLPPTDWTPRKRRARMQPLSDDRLRKALKQIADGHNDARQLAKDTLLGRQ